MKIAASKYVGVIGATSLVGRLLLPELVSNGYGVKTFSRRDQAGEPVAGVEWRKLVDTHQACCSKSVDITISLWICVAPIWVLPDYFSLLEAYGVKRIVVLSSTSRFTKKDSSESIEQETASRLLQAEGALQNWAEHNGVEWLILRPTLIYGLGMDKNISEIARFIHRFGFFPLVGKALGLRQPVHALDVADACRAALLNADVAGRSYNIAGGEALTYKEMVVRVFAALGRPIRVISVPLWLFRVSIFLLRILPRYQHWTASMAARMNRDQVFDLGEAERDLSYRPRPFTPSESDVLRQLHEDLY